MTSGNSGHGSIRHNPHVSSSERERDGTINPTHWGPPWRRRAGSGPNLPSGRATHVRVSPGPVVAPGTKAEIRDKDLGEGGRPCTFHWGH